MRSRRELALSLGATHAVDPTIDDAARAIIEITGTGADYTVDCIGLPAVVRAAVESLASPGICATVGFQGMDNEFSLNLGQLLWGRSLAGVIEGGVLPDVFIPRMNTSYRQGRFPFDRLVERVAFQEINKAIEASHHGSWSRRTHLLSRAYGLAACLQGGRERPRPRSWILFGKRAKSVSAVWPPST